MAFSNNFHEASGLRSFPGRVVHMASTADRVPLRSLLLLVVLAAVVFLTALLVGSSGIGVRQALAALAGGGDEATRNVLIAVRLPRVLAAFGVGSLLALSGVLLQALFRNPLADPYVLGVSGGAAVGALLAMIAGRPRCWCSRPRWPAPWARSASCTCSPAAAARRGCC